jgi:hypothetical protein
VNEITILSAQHALDWLGQQLRWERRLTELRDGALEPTAEVERLDVDLPARAA